MNKSITKLTQHFTGTASLAVVGLKLRELDLLAPVRELVQVEQKSALKLTDVQASGMPGS